MTTIKDFTIIYDGREYSEGEMDIEIFSQSLLAFGNILKIANQALNQDRTWVRYILIAIPSLL